MPKSINKEMSKKKMSSRKKEVEQECEEIE
jgi:hypothetical protein